MSEEKRNLLPGGFERKYRSEVLKEKISDIAMWAMIPSVTEDMESKAGIQRINENDLLFSFIDRYLSENAYAFEPNMRDGRFVLLPEDVSHQGIGVCISKEFSDVLEVGQFWYPCEFTRKKIRFGPQQVYVPVFYSAPDSELADMLEGIYLEKPFYHNDSYCTFPFDRDLTVTLSGDFLDDISRSTEKVRNALQQSIYPVQRNGEGLIQFMNWLMK